MLQTYSVNLGTSPGQTIYTPLIIGGDQPTSTLTLRSTSANGVTGADIIFQNGNNGSVESMRITNNGFVGLGTTLPSGQLEVVGEGAGFSQLRLRRFGGTPTVNFYSSDGTRATPTATTAQRQMGVYNAFGYDGSDFTANPSAVVRFVASEAFSLSANGAYIRFETTANGATTGQRTERMRIYADGNIGIGVGVTIPAALLHQDSGTATATYHKFTAATTTGKTATDGYDIGIDSSANGVHRQYENKDIIFYTNNAEVMRLLAAGNFQVPTTVTAGGTTGNQTINKISGTVNFAAAATAITVTNSLVSANSIVLAVVRTNDTTATIKNVVPGAGSFVINLGAAATAETSVGFFVIN